MIGTVCKKELRHLLSGFTYKGKVSGLWPHFDILSCRWINVLTDKNDYFSKDLSRTNCINCKDSKDPYLITTPIFYVNAGDDFFLLQ